jgi:hypothetical protein
MGAGGVWGVYVLVSPYKKAGALINCFPSRHRLHLNDSCVSQAVFSLYLNNVLKSLKLKCRSTSSAYPQISISNGAEKGVGGEYAVDDTGREGLFMRLPLKNLLLDRSRGDKSVDKTIFLLAVSPYSCEGLLICRWIPVSPMSAPIKKCGGRFVGGTGIKEDETICADEVEAAATCFGTQ